MPARYHFASKPSTRERTSPVLAALPPLRQPSTRFQALGADLAARGAYRDREDLNYLAPSILRDKTGQRGRDSTVGIASLPTTLAVREAERDWMRLSWLSQVLTLAIYATSFGIGLLASIEISMRSRNAAQVQLGSSCTELVWLDTAIAP